jgi:hypothetical protein
MLVTKRDIRNHGQVVLDQNANLNVKDANVRGDLRIHGKLIQVTEDVSTSIPYCELTIQSDEKSFIRDNEPFVWTVLVDDLKMFDGQSIVTIPVSGVYSVISRVYNADVDSIGSGTTLWINGDYTYSSVNAREGDHTSSMANIRPFRQGDRLQMNSILNTLIHPNHKQCYTFQITKLC